MLDTQRCTSGFGRTRKEQVSARFVTPNLNHMKASRLALTLPTFRATTSGMWTTTSSYVIDVTRSGIAKGGLDDSRRHQGQDCQRHRERDARCKRRSRL